MIRLVPHQEDWRLTFLALRKEIIGVLGSDVLTMEHFGSTSLGGIVAKPIIDMIGTVANLLSLDAILEKKLPKHIKNLGENGVSGRRYLVVSNPETTVAHIHFFEVGNSEYQDRILFRDYLRLNAETAREYEALKIGLAERFSDDPMSYWKGKATFVESVLNRAKSGA